MTAIESGFMRGTCCLGLTHSRDLGKAGAPAVHAAIHPTVLLLQGSAAPVASWTSARVAADLALSKDLMLKLDAEKGIEQSAFAPQLQQAPAETGATQGVALGTHLATLIFASQMLLFPGGLRPAPCITDLQDLRQLTSSNLPECSNAEC